MTKNSKFLCLVLCLLMLVCIFAACSKKQTDKVQEPTENETTQRNPEQSTPVQPPHEHSFGEWNTVQEATCTEDGSKQRTCSTCSVTETETISALGHNYIDHICENCGDISYSQGLNFMPNGDGTYSVSGIGTCTDTILYIPPTTPEGVPVTSIGDRAFYYCSSLTRGVIPDSVTSIGTYAFCGCSSLTSVTIGNGVTSIGYNAFEYCYKLVEVTNHSNLSLSAGSSDYGYVARYAKEVHTGESKIDNQNGFLFYTYGGVNYLLGYTGNETKLILPENYKGESYEIYRRAFYDCRSLMSIVIPDGVNSIGSYAFHGCYKLVEVINHSNLSLSAGSIDYGYIAYYAKEIHTSESKIDSQNGFLFYTYDGVNYLLGYAENVTELILPENYKGEAYEIYQCAFSDCSSLTSVVIGDGVTSIGNFAFLYCSSLTSIVISDSVTSIGGVAFYGCRSLKSIVIPDGVTSIGNSAFHDCRSLTSIKIPDGVTSIGNGAFYFCRSLTSIKIPDSVKIIGDNSFSDCSSMTSVVIPDSVKSIGDYAFWNCSSLTDIYFTGSEEEWNAIEKSGAQIPSTATIHFNYVPSES